MTKVDSPEAVAVPARLAYSVLFVAIALSLGIPYFTAAPAGSSPPPAVHSDDVDGAWVYAQRFVTDRLKAPATAVFPFGGATKHVKPLGGGRYRVDSYVDSQNGFGATIRQPFHLVVQQLPGTWQLETLRFDR